MKDSCHLLQSQCAALLFQYDLAKGSEPVLKTETDTFP